MGRLVEKKGFTDLVEACGILKRRRVRFSCHLVGEGELEGLLRERIHHLGLYETMELVGPQPQNEVFELIRNSSALAAPCVVGEDSNRDGLPTVLLEAMALGTPCISTDVTGIPEAVKHEQTGLMVRRHNPAELADAMHRLLTDAPLRDRLARGARDLIEAEFDVHRNCAALRDLFAGATSQAPAAKVEVA